LIALLLGFAGTAMSFGCERAGSGNAADADVGEPVRVAATVYALGDLARQVGGKYVQVESVIESGQSLDRYSPPPQVRDRLNRAELIVVGASMTEPWAVSDSYTPYAPQRVVRLDALTAAAAAAPTSGPSRPGISEAGVLWLDPVIVQQAANELAERLITKRPRHDIYFRHQADAVRAQVDELLGHYAPLFKDVPDSRRRVVALGGEFDPLARRFGIEVIHIVDDPPERLSEDQIRLLRDTARELGAAHGGGAEPSPTCLLVRADTPTALLQDLALRTGMRMVPLDSYGSTGNPDRDTIVKLLKYDIAELAQGLGATK
jgi:zinc transport system substrate-binding protein